MNTYIYTYNTYSAAVTQLYKQIYNKVKLKRTFTPDILNHKGVKVSKIRLGVDYSDTLISMANLALMY